MQLWLRPKRPYARDPLLLNSVREFCVDLSGIRMADKVASAGHRCVAVMIPSARISTAENRRGSSMAVHLEGRGIRAHRIVSDAFGQPEVGIDRILELIRDGAATAAMFPETFRSLVVTASTRASI